MSNVQVPLINASARLGEWARSYILQFDDVAKYWPAENWQKFLSVAVGFALPMLLFYISFTRYIIICRPASIKTYCTKVKALVVVIVTAAISIGISFHELFDASLASMRNIVAMEKTEIAARHEVFTGYLVIASFSSCSIGITVLSFVMTKRMNSSILKSIVFLQDLDADKYKTRVDAYNKLMHFNRTHCAVTVLSAVNNFTKSLYGEMMRYDHVENTEPIGRTDYAWGRAILEIMSCIEITLYPLILIVFLPSFAEALRSIKKCCHFAKTNAAEGEPAL